MNISILISNKFSYSPQVKGCVSTDVSCDNSFRLAPAVGVTTSAIRAAIDFTFYTAGFIATISRGALPPTRNTPVIGSLESKLNLLVEHW